MDNKLILASIFIFADTKEAFFGVLDTAAVTPDALSGSSEVFDYHRIKSAPFALRRLIGPAEGDDGHEFTPFVNA